MARMNSVRNCCSKCPYQHLSSISPTAADDYDYNTDLRQAMAPNGMTLDLPQEIIDQVIDEVASQAKYDHGDSPKALDTLKSCALVSRAFNFRSRNHIFSTIGFVVDASAQKRAGRLVQILRPKDNKAPLIQTIRQFNLLLKFRTSDVAPGAILLAGLKKPFIKTQKFLLGVLGDAGLRENKLYQVLDIMNDTSLTHFTLGAERSFVRWSTDQHNINDKLFHIIAKPSLRSLHLHNLWDLPEVFLRNAFQSSNLTEIKLSYLRFSRGELMPPLRDTQVPFAKLERMELRFISYKAFLAIIRTLELDNTGPFPTPNVPPIYSRIFSHLNTLSVYIPGSTGELASLWDIMQIAAPSLTTLAVQYHGSIDIPSPEPISLNPFKALKHLNFTSTQSTLGADTDTVQQYVANLLSSAAQPMSLESITMTSTTILRFRAHSDSLFRSSLGWNLLDNALNNPLFVNLKSVVFNVKVVIHDNGTSASKTGVQMRETSKLLPKMTASPSVDTCIYLHTIASIHALLPGFNFESS